MAATQARHWWFVARRRVLRAVISALRLPREARILEFGCGPGGNLPMLAEFGHVDAFESDAPAREHARAVTGIDVQPGALPHDWPAGQRRYDLVCLFDVLEHVAADGEALRVLRAALAPGGRLLLTVPAYPWLFSRHDTFHHHHRRYTAAQLRALAQAQGWQVQRLGYFNTLLFPLAAAKRLVARLAGHELGDDSQMPGPAVNAALGAVFGLERLWAPRAFMPFGLSAVAVLTPQAQMPTSGSR